GIRDLIVTGVQTCALPISTVLWRSGQEADFIGIYDRPQENKSRQFATHHALSQAQTAIDFIKHRLSRPQRDIQGRSRLNKNSIRSEEHTSELQSRSDLVCR